MHRTISLLSTLTILTFATAQDATAKAEWLQDFAAAKAQAKAEKKDLLIDFTGSDWCGWCIKLDEEVFSKDEFQKFAPQHFVLVKLDYPRNKDLVTEAIQAQNKELAKTYQVQGYPTILLTDHDGRVYGQTGYQDGGPEKYNTHLADLKKKGEGFLGALKKADGAKGLDRAKALDEALGMVEEEMATTHYLGLMEEICTLDADGKGGLKAKHETKVKELQESKMLDSLAEELQTAIGPMMEEKKFDEALAALDAAAKAPKNDLHKQMALFFKGMVMVQGKNDPVAALAEWKAAMDLKPTSPIGKQIEVQLPRLQKMADAKKGDGKPEEGKEKAKENGGK